MNYGIPYMGSKSSICKNICALFPKADNFYDLFGGGFSITHAMLIHRSKDFKQFHFNEIRNGVGELIQDAIAEKYSYENFKPKWVSREEFFEKKEQDFYIKICWSFGNNGKDYLYGKGIEQYNKSIHNAIIFNDFDDEAKSIFGMDRFRDGLSVIDKRLFLKERVRVLNSSKQLQHLERLEQLQNLQQLEKLGQLLHFYNKSYEQVEIKENSIIYCDIPYENTEEYDKNKYFNRVQFFDWADNQKGPVFISEYNIGDKRFVAINHVEKKVSLNHKGGKVIKVEKLYVNKAGYKKMRDN